MYLIKLCTEVLQMRSPAKRTGRVRQNRLGMTAMVYDSCLHTPYEL